MSDDFATLQEASFAGTIFPVDNIEVNGGNDLAEFSAFRRDGADIQPAGRKAWKGSLSIPCINTTPLVTKYGTLFPDLAYDLLQLFTTTPIATLTLPTFGNLTAAISEVTHTSAADDRSGVRIRVTFIEHNASAAVLYAATASGSPPDASAPLPLLATAADTAAAGRAGYTPTAPVMQSQQDYIDAAPRTFSQTDDSIRQMLSVVNRNLNLPSLAGVAAHDAYAALLNLRAGVYALRDRLIPASQRRSVYTVPRDMALWQVSLAVYGDTSHTGLLLSANSFTDPNAIRAGTRVVVLPLTS